MLVMYYVNLYQKERQRDDRKTSSKEKEKLGAVQYLWVFKVEVGKRV